MPPICPICTEEIAEADDSEEHIIAAAIGGRRTVTGLLHRVCNNKAGHTWDAELERQLRALALHFGVRRQRGQTRRMLVTTSAREELLMGSKGQLSMAKPIIAKTPTANGTNYQITAGSLESAREVLEGLKRKHPGIDVEATLATGQVRRSYAQGAVKLELGFGGEGAGQSLVKSALALTHEAGIPIDLCGDALSYLRGVGAPCFGYYFVGDLIAERPAAMPLHCVAIEANPETGLILGYVEFFGIHRAVVCLGRGYDGGAVKSVYAVDPRTGAELNLSVRLGFDAADIEAIYDYQMDDAAGRQEAFSAVFGPALAAQHETERKRVFKEAFDYAWANCGAVENEILTDENKRTIARLFAERAVPFMLQAGGVAEQSARRQAEAFADFVIRTA